jgi:hypothetical protein
VRKIVQHVLERIKSMDIGISVSLFSSRVSLCFSKPDSMVGTSFFHKPSHLR